MNKKSIGIIILIGVLLAGLYYLTMGKKVEVIPPQDNAVEERNEEDQVASQEKQVFEIEVGKEAPNFILRNLDGEEISLQDYRGKIVLINFWATWCVYCDIEMPDLQKLDKENEDLVVLAVNVMEHKETVEKYIKEGGYDFEVVLDEDGTIARTYLVGGYPASYFVDEEGIFQGAVPGMMTYEQMNQALQHIRENK
ncbi:TlpA family protein disulfide reductase [Alkaliphilus sp. B6464]|uniref:TlpA family protein disulfide reductase n=1 Tax=Alkaliphilus sp. B6464 TaxID=2731219 RepID=UPI001BA78775|nr:redoxin domain-containing protein [Alkaliphilus sp. B6464]